MTNIQLIDTIFKPEWKDSNSLELTSKDKAYCGECLYLIKLDCVKEMKGQIIIPE